MSEPSSLFARISIGKENLDAFLSAPPKTPFFDTNWINWWNSRQMVSPRPFTAEDLYAYHNACHKEILEGWQKQRNTGTFYDYNEAAQLLNLGIIFFSENFIEMIPMLALLFDLAGYKNDNAEDFVIVYPFFWGDNDLNVWITFEAGNALLDSVLKNTGEVDADKLTYAQNYLTQKAKQIFSQQ